MKIVKTKSFKIATNQYGNKDSEKFALVLPGRLDTKDYPHMGSHAQLLASKGFFAISFDPPGTWESPGEISIYSMSNYLKSVNELIEHFGNRKTLIVGHSRGGAIAMKAAIDNKYITRLVVIMSYYSYKPDVHPGSKDSEWKEKGFKLEKRDIPGKIGKEFKEFKLPFSFMEDSSKFDMSGGIKKMKKPKLFFLGKRDTIVNPDLIRKIYKEASEPKQLHELDSNHDYRFKKNLVDEVNTAISKFLLL